MSLTILKYKFNKINFAIMNFIKLIIKMVDRLLGRKEGASEILITYTTYRAGYDLRYAIDSTKLKD